MTGFGGSVCPDFTATAVTTCISTDFGESWVGSYPLDDGYSNLKQVKESVYCINYGKLKRSPDYGRNWFELSIDSVQSCALFEGDSTNLFLYTNRGLLRSNNSATSWKTCSLVGLPNVPLQELRFDGENLLIILSNQLYISKDLGDSWSKVEFGLFNFNYVDHLFVLGKLLIATKADDIVSSNDSGLTWRSIKNSLGYNFLQPQVLLHQGKLLICGVGLPVQLSNEDFTTWYEIDAAGLPFNNDNYGMAIKGQDLYLAQRTSGLFKRNLNEILKVSNVDFTTTSPVVFPNPATQVLQVQVKEGASYEIYGIDGRTWVAKSKLVEEIDVSRLPPGIYILKINETQATRCSKFAKQ